MSDTTTQAELPAYLRDHTPEKLRELFDNAGMVIQSQYSLLMQVGSGDVAPPDGGDIDAETARNIGTIGYRARLDINNAFYGMLELDQYRQEQEAAS